MMDVQRFICDANHARTPKALEALTSDIASEMGFEFITLFHHVDLSSIEPSYSHMASGKLIGITTASVAWSEFYRDNKLIECDPRVAAVNKTIGSFATNDIGRLVSVTASHRAMIESQRRANIGEGYTVPVHFPGEPSGSCSFSVSPGRALPSRNFAMAHWIGSSAFEAARTIWNRARRSGSRLSNPTLTERQLQCVVLVARGYNERLIGRRLGIAAETVKRHLKDARTAYGATKSIQLVTHALHDGQITLADLLTEHPAKVG
jgi:LuxR family quorum-sensing system transcriptional regulator CciR